MRREIVAMAISAIACLVFAHAGGPESLGAHPFWAVRIGYYGGAAGLGIGLMLVMLRVPPGLRFLLGLVAGGLCLAAARIGAARFAESFAEDALAGKSWFFGWIGFAAALVVAVQALIAWKRLKSL